MTETTTEKISWIRQLWERIKSQIIQDVPTENAVCEYDCDKLECSDEKWTDCENRLRKPGDSRGSTAAEEETV
jgi:hypothetical protein